MVTNILQDVSQELHSLQQSTNDYRRRTMKDKMFGRPIVELPPIHPVGAEFATSSCIIHRC
jgi:hypothetical protein